MSYRQKGGANMAEDREMAKARGQPDTSAQPEAFPYHYGLEADNYTFYRVPKILFSEHEFSGLSTEAKMLYGLMLDRMQLSAKNNWVDEQGRIYIFFKIESIMAALSCGNKKACSLLAELDDRKGIGLISRIKQGMGRPDRIYVHKCITEEMSRRHFMKCHNDISCDVRSTTHDVSESQRNNTEMNNKKNNDTESIESYQHDAGTAGDTPTAREYDRMDRMDRRYWKQYFENALSIDILRSDYPMRRDTLDEILTLIVDTCSSRQEYIRVGRDDKPAAAVREAFMKLTDSHIRYVMDCLEDTVSEIRNIRQYLLTALYNSTMTISNYYDAMVRSDMWKGGLG